MGFSVVVHCGAYKTGSSSIQNFLYDNKDFLLSSHGVLYPKAGLRLERHVGVRHADLAYSKREKLDGLLENLKLEVESAKVHGLKCVVLSSEAWAHIDRAEGLRRIFDLFRRLGCRDFRCYLYIRNIFDYAIKHYREFSLRNWNTKKINDYVVDGRKFFDYNGIIHQLQQSSHFVECVDYSDVESVLDDFLKKINICDFKGFVGASRKYNPGVGAVTTEVVRLFSPAVKNLSRLPCQKDLEDRFGIVFSKNIREPLNNKSFNFIGEDYIKKFSSLTGFGLEKSCSILSLKEVEGLSVYNLSNAVESMVLDYFRS